MSNPSHPVQMAGLAQKMAKMLFLDCPPNYICGGPAYAALVSMDSILTLMGCGIAMIQRAGGNTEPFQKFVKESAVTGDGILTTFTQHKSQVLAGALYALLCDFKTRQPRECCESTENALLATIQWFLKKSGTSPKRFAERILGENHDELEQLERELEPKKAGAA